MQKREIDDQIQAWVKPVDIELKHDNALREWLETQSQRRSGVYLLAFADDGVIWGKVENGHLITSSDAMPGSVSPSLRTETLQEARLFWRDGEIMIWRDANVGTLAARSILETGSETPAYTGAFDEEQLLWGDQIADQANGFTRVEDGSQGLSHIVPLVFKPQDNVHLRLTVRHYLAYDHYDCAYVALSRLVSLSYGERLS